ncbi:MAG: DUF3592 domain-containing protein [Clostridium sp.]|nr:DUF3592 domain-containing protein [Clostridium sp.]MCM1547423.1 DUF3592 domain-containing protein [Ruminococcus sp.]
MKKRRMSLKTALNLLGIIFVVIGSVFFVFGGLYISSWIVFRKNAVQTEAVITITDYAGYPIKSGKPYSFFDEAIPMATYSIRDDIGDYTRELSGYAPELYTGKKATVYFYPDDPGRVGIFSLVFFVECTVIGVLFLGSGIILLCLNKVKKEHKHEKKKNER